MTKPKKKPATKPIPDGYHAVTPYLLVAGADAAIAFYKKAFGAVEEFRCAMPGGKIGHAEFKIGDSKVMIADEAPEMGYKGPNVFGGTPVAIHLYVEDVDAVVARAEKAGAKVTRPAEDKFYGDRAATLEDPFGHQWHVSTHVEDVTMEEIEKRMKALGFA